MIFVLVLFDTSLRSTINIIYILVCLSFQTIKNLYIRIAIYRIENKNINLNLKTVLVNQFQKPQYSRHSLNFLNYK